MDGFLKWNLETVLFATRNIRLGLYFWGVSSLSWWGNFSSSSPICNLRWNSTWPTWLARRQHYHADRFGDEHFSSQCWTAIHKTDSVLCIAVQHCEIKRRPWWRFELVEVLILLSSFWFAMRRLWPVKVELRLVVLISSWNQTRGTVALFSRPIGHWQTTWHVGGLLEAVSSKKPRST